MDYEAIDANRKNHKTYQGIETAWEIPGLHRRSGGAGKT
jgi:hypothetical protein